MIINCPITTKHGYFDALRSELGATAVKVALVLPGPVDSDIVSAAVRPEGTEVPVSMSNSMRNRFHSHLHMFYCFTVAPTFILNRVYRMRVKR
jgi:short-subunit dehydrogenase